MKWINLKENMWKIAGQKNKKNLSIHGFAG